MQVRADFVSSGRLVHRLWQSFQGPGDYGVAASFVSVPPEDNCASCISSTY